MGRPEVIIEKERSRFFDGGTDDEAPNRDAEAEYALRREYRSVGGEPPRELFRLERRIGYDDRRHGELLVPKECATFLSDLTSVPDLFTWLVPKSGAHLPAALVHDGLVREPDTPPDHIGPDIGRVEADRVFRDAMADSGTGLIRRWLVWTAVTLATMWERQDTSDNPTIRNYYRWVMVATIVAISWLGYQATADLVDRSGRWWLTYELPWILGDTWWCELATGIAGAVLLPIGIAVFWGKKFFVAGVIAGWGLAVLFHITLALVAISGVYVAAERIVTKRTWVGFVLAGLAVGASVMAFVLCA